MYVLICICICVPRLHNYERFTKRTWENRTNSSVFFAVFGHKLQAFFGALGKTIASPFPKCCESFISQSPLAFIHEAIHELEPKGVGKTSGAKKTSEFLGAGGFYQNWRTKSLLSQIHMEPPPLGHVGPPTPRALHELHYTYTYTHRDTYAYAYAHIHVHIHIHIDIPVYIYIVCILFCASSHHYSR